MNGDGAPAVPVACSLDGAARGERAHEWRSFVGSSVTAVQVDDRAVRLVLRETDAALTAAASLAQREKRCCAFFDVSIVLEPGRRTLVLAVPQGAEDALATFATLLSVP
jgi:hypothetical protein